MNREALRKELEDYGKWFNETQFAGGKGDRVKGYFVKCDYTSLANEYLTTRLAALDDGDGHCIDPKELMKTAVNDFNLYEHKMEVASNKMDAWLQTKEATQIAWLIGHSTKPLDDGQEGKGLVNFKENNAIVAKITSDALQFQEIDKLLGEKATELNISFDATPTRLDLLREVLKRIVIHPTPKIN